MNATPWSDWPEYDRRVPGGYIYVIEYTTGVVKVGMTSNPQRRMTQLRAVARAHGVDIARAWLSAPHSQHDVSEKALISAACRLGERMGEESFRAHFHDVVAAASRLDLRRFTTPPLFDSPARLRAAERRQRALELRAAGMSIRKIAAELGASVATIHGDVRAEGPPADEFYVRRLEATAS